MSRNEGMYALPPTREPNTAALVEKAEGSQDDEADPLYGEPLASR